MSTKTNQYDTRCAADDVEQGAEHWPVLEEVILNGRTPTITGTTWSSRILHETVPATLSHAISFVVDASDGTSKTGRRASSKVLRGKIDCALLYENIHGEGGVAVDFGLIVRKGLMVELEERPRQRRDRSFCPIDYLSERSNRRRTIAERTFSP